MKSQDNQKRPTQVDIQKDQLAIVGMNNVSVIDNRINKLNNDYQNFVDALSSTGYNAPIFSRAMNASNASAAEVIALGGTGLTLEDKVVVISLGSLIRPTLTNDCVAALLFAENYMNFKQGRVHDVEIHLMKGANNYDVANMRTLVVEPTAGVNSVAEYTVLPCVQPITIGMARSVAFNGGTIKLPSAGSRSAGNYITPWPMQQFEETDPNLYKAIVVIFKGMKDKGELSVTPVFGGTVAARMVAEMLNS